MNTQKIIFCNSYGPRTGHNFVSEAIKVFSNHEVLAHNKSETRLSHFLHEYKKISNSIPYKSDQDFFNKIIIEKIRPQIIANSSQEYIMIKNTSFVGVNYLKEFFPNDIHILVLRNPIDTYNSMIKAMNLNKKGFKYKLKKIGKLTGLYPLYYSNKLSSLVLSQLPNLNNFHVLKYEDLVLQKESILLDLKQKFNCDKSLSKIKEELNNIKVINTSFYEENNAKNIWDAKEKSMSFNPINRKKNSYLIRKGVELGAKQLKSTLGY